MINRLSKLPVATYFFVVLMSLLFSPFILADDESESTTLSIKSAEYDVDRQRLSVKLEMQGERPFQVSLMNAQTGRLLVARASEEDSLKVRINNIQAPEVPCVIEAQLKDMTDSRRVEHAPETCSADKEQAESSRDAALEIKIDDAKYEDEDLIVKGELTERVHELVTLYDDLTGQLLSAENRNRDFQHFSFKVGDLDNIPCRIRVQIGAISSVKLVAHAPDHCSSQPPVENQSPVCAISSPSQGLLDIALGDVLNFRGVASDPEGGVLTYEWDFNGGADVRPTVLEPGDIYFDVNNGRFLVHFIVTDEHNARCTADVSVNVGANIPNPPFAMVPQQSAPNTIGSGDGRHVVLPANDLGMHCADLGSYPLSILPPFNTINVHVIRKGSIGANKPLILDVSSVGLRYSAASSLNDPAGSGSINSTSQNYPIGSLLADAQIKKTDFWDDFKGKSIVSFLFPSLNPLPDEGLATEANADLGRGLFMPGKADPYGSNNPQGFSMYVAAKGWFTAQGIPLTPVDDQGRLNSYPLMRVQAIANQTGETLATTDVVTPVSAEVDCRDCHAAGQVGANSAARSMSNADGMPAPVFVVPTSNDRLAVEIAAKKNILILHDYKHFTQFIENDEPVLCAGCHKSNALVSVGGPAGMPELDSMSKVMHGFHGRLQKNNDGSLMRYEQGEPDLVSAEQWNEVTALIPVGKNVSMEQNCFQCHPGKVTQCFRGAMYTAGQTCDSCHGDLLAVGGEFARADGTKREPWADEPTCGACHTGIGSDTVADKAFDPNDPAAESLAPKTLRFAENDHTLYRESLDGHAQVACEACHGSPHAIWPNRNPAANDNVTAQQLQGHAGTLSECTVCHEDNSFPNGTLSGPHGMHPVNDPSWMDEDNHGDFAKNSRAGDQCADCHGADHRGTRLSKVPVDRVLKDKEGKVLLTLRAGEEVSCDLCHSLSKSFSN